MPRPTVSERLRAKLRTLLRERGEAANLSRYSGIPPQIISMFRTGLRPTAIGLDDLDELAGYFRISIGELLGAAKPGELSGDEQRMVHAFRVLPPTAQDHFLAVIEHMSVSVRHQKTVLHERRLDRKIPDSPPTPEAVAHGAVVPVDPIAEVARLRSLIDNVMLVLADAAGGGSDERPLHGAGHDQPNHG